MDKNFPQNYTGFIFFDEVSDREGDVFFEKMIIKFEKGKATDVLYNSDYGRNLTKMYLGKNITSIIQEKDKLYTFTENEPIAKDRGKYPDKIYYETSLDVYKEWKLFQYQRKNEENGTNLMMIHALKKAKLSK